MTKDLLTKEEYIQILQEKFQTNNVTFLSAKIAPLSEHVEGFVGDHYILTLSYKKDGKEGIEEFFIKTRPTKTELQRNIAKEMNVYDKEIFLYHYLFKEFEKYGYDTSFAPKSYFYRPNETLVMENLKKRDFKLFPRGNYFDLAHCKIVLKALATYHGNSLSYEETKSKEMGKEYRVKDYKPDVFNELFFKLKMDDFFQKFFDTSFNSYVTALQLLPEAPEWKASFKKRLLAVDIPKIFAKKLPYRTTCCHGDLWSNNMLFKYENGVPVHSCLVDFQILRHQHPGFDVMLLLYSNTSKEFRDKHTKELLDFYYKTLEGVLKKHGYNAREVIPKEHIIGAAEALRLVALFQGGSVRFMTFLPAEYMTNAVNNGGDDLEKLMMGDAHAKMVMDACSNDKVYRQFVFDDIYELNELMIAEEKQN